MLGVDGSRECVTISAMTRRTMMRSREVVRGGREGGRAKEVDIAGQNLEFLSRVQPTRSRWHWQERSARITCVAGR